MISEVASSDVQPLLAQALDEALGEWRSARAEWMRKHAEWEKDAEARRALVAARVQIGLPANDVGGEVLAPEPLCPRRPTMLCPRAIEEVFRQARQMYAEGEETAEPTK